MAIEVHRTVTISKSPDEVYRFWRQLENLPRFMSHLESVTETGNGGSHWVAKAPARRWVEWDADIVDDIPGELITWRSREGASVPNAGAVRFSAAPGDRGTEVHVALSYAPPAGQVGAAIAKLFGEEPDQQVREDLRRFKQVMETGEVATTKGQPSAHESTES